MVNEKARADRFVTEAGLELRLCPIRASLLQLARMGIEKQFRDAGEPVDVPTYTTLLASGETQTFEHVVSEKGNTLDVPNDAAATARNWAAWERYHATQQRLEAAQGEEVFLLQLELGVEYEVPEADLCLLRKYLTRYGREYPDDPDRAKALWLVYFGLSPIDKAALGAQMELLTLGKAVKPEQVEAFQTELWRAVEEKGRTAFDDALHRLHDVVGESSAGGDASGEGVGVDTEPVGQPG